MIAVKDGTLCVSPSHSPQLIGATCAFSNKDSVVVVDHDLRVSRVLSTQSDEFRSNYIDNNIQSVEFWDTPYAKQDKKYEEFTVIYRNGRRLRFRVGEIPVRYALNARPGTRTARSVFKPHSYIKRGGFIYPEFHGEGSTPRLIDIATTIEYNHRQREKFLEVATVTFTFAMILTAYVSPPEAPEMPTRTGGIRARLPGLKTDVRRVTWQNLAEWEQLELAGSGGRVPRAMREGGHILEHHIEISDVALQARAAKTAEKVATKFVDADTAVHAVNRVLDANWPRVRSFLSGLGPGEAPFLEISATLEKSVGSGYKVLADGSVTKLEGLKKVVVFVQADGVGGWLVRTAFPTP